MSSMEAETSQRFETDVGDVLICDESGVARIIIDLPNSKIIEITMS